MNAFARAGVCLVVWPSLCAGIAVPRPDLAQALKASDTVVVARVISGKGECSATRASGDLSVRILRVLKGDLAAGTQIRINTRGHRQYIPGPTSRTPRHWAVEHFTGIWFLHRKSARYSVAPVIAGAGEPERASLRLPEGAQSTSSSTDVSTAIAEEIVATLRAMARRRPAGIKPAYNVQVVNGTVDRSHIFGRYAAWARELVEALPTIYEEPKLLAIYRELASDRLPYLRAVAVEGLIRANDPAGPKQAAAEFRTLFREAYAGAIASKLAGYRNPEDAEAIVAIGRLAIEYRDLDMPLLEESAAYALNALHTRESLPALIKLLDSDNARVGGLALNGICLFVRNSPMVTPQSIPSGSWRESREPAPFRNADTDAHCWMDPLPASHAGPEYKAFWKRWWQHHAAGRAP